MLLVKLKGNIRGFDCRVLLRDGAPEAILWMTDSMCKNWMRHGHIVFLDAMMRQQNHLDWPHIRPCGLDHNNRKAQFCEFSAWKKSLTSVPLLLICLPQWNQDGAKSPLEFFGEMGSWKNPNRRSWDSICQQTQVTPTELACCGTPTT